MATPLIEVFYFPVRGRGEVARLILALSAKPGEYRINELRNFDFKKDPKCLLGQMPYATIDGKKVCQSHAIERALAARFRLPGSAGGDESLLVDMMHETCNDEEHLRQIFESRTTARAVFKAGGPSDTFLARIEKLYETGVAGLATGAGAGATSRPGPYLLGAAPSLGDIGAFEVATHARQFAEYLRLPDPLAKLPKFRAAVEAFAAIPQIRAYLASPARSKYISGRDPWMSTCEAAKQFPELKKFLYMNAAIGAVKSCLGQPAGAFVKGAVLGAAAVSVGIWLWARPHNEGVRSLR